MQEIDGIWLAVDDGTATHVFDVMPTARRVATIGTGERPYAIAAGALLVTAASVWRAVSLEDGHEILRIPLDAGHPSVQPRPCITDGGTTLAWLACKLAAARAGVAPAAARAEAIAAWRDTAGAAAG